MAVTFPLSCATSSLNPFPASTIPLHDLPSKLHAIANAGFKGIELAFPDFLSFARQFLNKDVGDKAWDDLCVAAREVKILCQGLRLEIMMLQPFSNFEGWEKGSKEREDAFERARGWIRIMQELGTDMLQVRCISPCSPFSFSSKSELTDSSIMSTGWFNRYSKHNIRQPLHCRRPRRTLRHAFTPWLSSRL